MKKLPATLILAGLAVSAAPASAFQMRPESVPASTHTVYLNGWVQLFLPDEYDALMDAAELVDENASTQRFELVIDDDVFYAINNTESESGMTTDAALLCGRIACTTLVVGGGDILETDTFFDLDYAWALNDDKSFNEGYSATGTRPLLNSAVHEYLHTLGLQHDNDVFSIMGRSWTAITANAQHTDTTVSEDSTQGLISVYGPRGGVVSTFQDLSVTHWKWTGTSGDYSVHGRTSITPTAGGALPMYADFEPRYQVSAGQALTVEQTVENHGIASHTFQVRWYLSTNYLISTSDTLLATSTMIKGVGGPHTWTRNVVLPANLASGTYWIGVVVDTQNAVAERNENNNNEAYIAAITVP